MGINGKWAVTCIELIDEKIYCMETLMMNVRAKLVATKPFMLSVVLTC